MQLPTALLIDSPARWMHECIVKLHLETKLNFKLPRSRRSPHDPSVSSESLGTHKNPTKESVLRCHMIHTPGDHSLSHPELWDSQTLQISHGLCHNSMQTVVTTSLCFSAFSTTANKLCLNLVPPRRCSRQVWRQKNCVTNSSPIFAGPPAITLVVPGKFCS